MYYKHRLYGTPEYNVFRRMIDRCENPKCKQFSYYGGRGIKVCAEWRHSPELFIAYMGKRPSPKHQIDRINNDGNYEPGNVRWATPKQNTNNRRCTLLLTARGETLPLSEWAERTGLSYELLFERFGAGWSASRILDPSKQIKNPLITYDGRTMPLSDWAKELGLTHMAFRARVKRHGVPAAFTRKFDRAEHMRRHRRTEAAIRDSATGRFIA